MSLSQQYPYPHSPSRCLCSLLWRSGLPYTTVSVTHPWGDLTSSIACQPRGCQHRTIYLRRSLSQQYPYPQQSPSRCISALCSGALDYGHLRRCIDHPPLVRFSELDYSTNQEGSSITRQPRGCQYRTIRLRKALGEIFQSPTLLTHVEILSTENRPLGGGGDTHRRLWYTG